MFRLRWARMVWGAAIAAVVALFVCSFFIMWWVVYTDYDTDGTSTYRATSYNFWGMIRASAGWEEPKNDGRGSDHIPSDRRIIWEEGVTTTAVTVQLSAIAGAVIAGVWWKRKPAGEA